MNHQVKDRTGFRYGRLTVIRFSEERKSGGVCWVCECDCGKEIIVSANSLATGNTVSCGCYNLDKIKERQTKHGHSSNGIISPEFRTYRNMKMRCYDTKNKSYKNYGGRGIKICDRWLESFENFLQDMGLRPSPNHSIDRFPNNDGDYEPGNCRWATRYQQGRGRTDNEWREFEGKRMILTDWAISVGTNYINFEKHLRRGKTFEETIAFYRERNKKQEIGV
jgi:hypothetical protein